MQTLSIIVKSLKIGITCKISLWSCVVTYRSCMWRGYLTNERKKWTKTLKKEFTLHKAKFQLDPLKTCLLIDFQTWVGFGSKGLSRFCEALYLQGTLEPGNQGSKSLQNRSIPSFEIHNEHETMIEWEILQRKKSHCVYFCLT